MMRGHRSFRDPRVRPLVRLVGLAALAGFLLAQSWMVCAPLCLLQEHPGFTAGGPVRPDRAMHCHSDDSVLGRPPLTQALDPALPTPAALPFPPLRLVAVGFVPPAPIQLQQIPTADPPPPRPV
jgi:hypothetical protein